LRRSSALRACAAAAVAVGVAAPLVRRHLTRGKFGKRTAVVSALAWQAPAALVLATRPNRLRAAAVYALQMWAYIAHYDMPDDDPDWIARRLKVQYPITCDRLIGAGEIPTLRLQRALGKTGQVQRHDTLLSWLHWSWFIVPHGSVAYVLLRRPERYERAATMMAATFDAGVLTYWLVPTAPPWWAGENGYLPPVRRIMVEAGSEFWGQLWQRLYDSLGRNPFAAMPSLHFGTSVMAAHVLGEVGRKEAIAGWTYAFALGFALVYLGEHYVTDLIAGFALAEAVRIAAPHLAPAAKATADSLRGIAPEST
jgi:membrane-associated phospholipid phosphatase